MSACLKRSSDQVINVVNIEDLDKWEMRQFDCVISSLCGPIACLPFVDVLFFCLFCRVERSTDQVIKPVNVEALSKWVGKIPADVLRDMAVIAPMLSRLGYDPHANPPNYGRPDPRVLDNTRRVSVLSLATIKLDLSHRTAPGGQDFLTHMFVGKADGPWSPFLQSHWSSVRHINHGLTQEWPIFFKPSSHFCVTFSLTL